MARRIQTAFIVIALGRSLPVLHHLARDLDEMRKKTAGNLRRYGPLMADLTHHRWDDIPREDLSPTIARQMIWGDRSMIAHVHLKEGAVVPRHEHHNEQLTYILSGALEFTFDEGEPIVVRAGEVLVIPGGVPHAALALEDTLDVDVFAPPREDWINATDDYLRG
jgi:quercetin dioxygenase-like cupin family protein